MDRRAFATSWAKVSLADGRDNAIQSARGAGVSKSLKPVLTTSAPGKTPVSYSPLEGYCKDQNTVGVFSYNDFILPKLLVFECEFSGLIVCSFCVPVVNHVDNITEWLDG
jgi:hypothetical protein